ncbi:MAG TPA: DMT family transporter [Planctomycetota bacterium]|nr:DMT family transporter [Planctomycetota bacterium]
MGASRRSLSMSARPIRAYLWMLTSALSFSTMGALSRLLSVQSDWRFLALVRAALMLVFAGAIAWGSRTPFSVIGTPILWMRSLVGSLSMICTYFTLTHDLPFAEATTLIKSYPMWVAILSWVVLRDRPSGKVWIAILTGAAGVVAISQPHFNHATLTLAVGILSAMCTAVVMLGLNKLSDVEPRAIVLHFAGVSTVIMGAVYLFSAPKASIGAFEDSRGLAMLVAMGVLGTVGQIALTKAFAFGDPSKVSVVGLSELAFGVLYDRVLWQRQFGVITLAGIALVAAPTAWLLATSRRPRGESPAPLESSVPAKAP